MIDATQTFGAGDRWVSEQLDIRNAIVVINKIDAVSSAKLLAQLGA
ncbi:MAG: GTPase Era, partial [Actinobacteria bacterium]|nr:GTPase Era [Actinomycetota bacterium]